MVAVARRWAAAVAAVCALCLPHIASAAERIALVIGAGAYRNAPALGNPARDAQAVHDLLTKAGFASTALFDPDNRTMRRALRDFGERAPDADVAVVFFAGHGLEAGGVNYLVPVDAELTTPAAAADEAVSLDAVLDRIAPARRLRLVILDACRNNPFRAATRQIGVVGGLAAPKAAPGGTLIAYAAAAGSVASDGEGEHSPYSAALLKNLTKPGVDVLDAIRAVGGEVAATTSPRQEPAFYGSLSEKIALAPAAAPAVAMPSPPAPSPPAARPDAAFEGELAFQEAQRLDTLQAYRDWQTKFPDHPRRETVLALIRRLYAADLWSKAQQAPSQDDRVSLLERLVVAYGDTVYGGMARDALRAISPPSPPPPPHVIDVPVRVDPPPPPPVLPSFARPSWCGNRLKEIEQTICGSARLSSLDLELNRLYQSASPAIVQTQPAWKQRRDACVSVADPERCVERVYEDRLAEMRVDARPPAPNRAQPRWCRNAQRASELAICASPGLWDADARLDDAFRRRVQQDASVSIAQQRWLARRDACMSRSNPVACMAAAYEARILELEQGE